MSPALLAQAATLAPVQVMRERTNLVLTFPGKLQQAAQAQGPYTNVTGALSPHRAPLGTAPAAFWRARRDELAGFGQRLAAGDGHTLAIQTDGSLWAWGNNISGQLGNGNITETNVPQRVPTNGTWKAVATGFRHTLAVQTDGSLWAWGGNSSGRLGNGSFYDTNMPQLINATGNWQTVVAGMVHSMGLRADGSLWAWGQNGSGQLGDGTYGGSLIPKQIGIGATWQAMAAGYDHTVALRTDGTLWTWGDNYSGQLGNSTARTNLPQQIVTNATWKAVAAGGELARGYSLAVRIDGTLWAWGDNYYGQLGIGTYIARTNTPQQVGTNANWQSVVAGLGNHTLALREDGTLWSWGRAGFGQLGAELGRFIWRTNTPQWVGTNHTWLSMSAGDFHSVALRADGSLWAWGVNGGAFGNGNDNGANTPQPVLGGAVWGPPPP